MGRIILFAFLLWGALPSTTEAQPVRAGDTFYLNVGGGLADYAGENDGSPLLDRVTNLQDFFDAAKFRREGPFPYAVVGEVGYQLVPSIGLGVGYQFGQYPLSSGIPFTTDPTLPGSGGDLGTARHTVQALGRYTFKAKSWTVAPYLDTGINVTFGGKSPGAGPVAGLGLDVSVSDRLSMMFGARFNVTFGDAATDGIDTATPLDVLSALPTIGVKRTFRRPAVPPRILAVEGPAELEVGELGSFTVRVNEEASRPLDYQWDYGDAATATARTASHAYDRPGTYEVAVTARNEAGVDQASHRVRVVSPPPPLRVRSLNAIPNPATVGDRVRFESRVEGRPPFSYEWRFGDGTTDAGPGPTHRYETPGTYTVHLEVSNTDGTVRDSLVLQVNPPSICKTVEEFNSVFFDPNSSELPDDAEPALEENVEVILECPDLPVRVEGYAAPNERNGQSLSEDRAQAVADFYEQNGVDSSRIKPRGNGTVEARTDKKGSLHQFRRVDTVPIRNQSSDAGNAHRQERPNRQGPAPPPPMERVRKASSEPGPPTWGLVVGSLKTAHRAAAMAQQYRAQFKLAQLPVQIVTADFKHGRQYRVVLGRFDRFETSQDALAKHEDRLPSDSWSLRLQ